MWPRSPARRVRSRLSSILVGPRARGSHDRLLSGCPGIRLRWVRSGRSGRSVRRLRGTSYSGRSIGPRGRPEAAVKHRAKLSIYGLAIAADEAGAASPAAPLTSDLRGEPERRENGTARRRLSRLPVRKPSAIPAAQYGGSRQGRGPCVGAAIGAGSGRAGAAQHDVDPVGYRSCVDTQVRHPKFRRFLYALVGAVTDHQDDSGG